jgi:hypothetical protein
VLLLKPVKIKKITALPALQSSSKNKAISEKRKQERLKALEELRGLWEDKDDSFFDLGRK